MNQKVASKNRYRSAHIVRVGPACLETMVSTLNGLSLRAARMSDMSCLNIFFSGLDVNKFLEGVEIINFSRH